MEDFRVLLRNVDGYYDGFEHAVISYIKMPGNDYKKDIIEEFIRTNTTANSSDVLEYMINDTGFWDVYSSKNVHAGVVEAS